MKRHDKENRRRKIHAVISLGVYDRLKKVITDTTYREYLADTYIIDLNKEVDEKIDKGDINALPSFGFIPKSNKSAGYDWSAVKDPQNGEVIIKPTWAYHDDKTGISDSFGFVIQFKTRKQAFQIGYTGDTKWVRGCFDQYKECDAVLVHLGSLIRAEKDKQFKDYKTPKECRELIADVGHPYLFGLLHYMTQLAEVSKATAKRKLVLLSEFGEELKGRIRIDLNQRLSELYRQDLIFLPVDVGLSVRLDTEGSFKTFCLGCKAYVEADRIRCQHFGHGHDEALFYFCDTCLKSKPGNVLHDSMHQVCEFGFALRKADV
jgi:hypothetical protein